MIRSIKHRHTNKNSTHIFQSIYYVDVAKSTVPKNHPLDACWTISVLLIIMESYYSICLVILFCVVLNRMPNYTEYLANIVCEVSFIRFVAIPVFGWWGWRKTLSHTLGNDGYSRGPDKPTAGPHSVTWIALVYKFLVIVCLSNLWLTSPIKVAVLAWTVVALWH
jgi:hypothetical protein